jgi:glycosidase
MGSPVRAAFHVRRTAAERYAIEAALFGARGDLLTTDLLAIRRLAARMNADRPATAPSVLAAEIAALGLIHEVGHVLIDRHDRERGTPSMPVALDAVRGRIGPEADRLLDRFGEAFPNPGARTRRRRADPPETRLAELLLTRVANENPAIGPLRELVDDRILAEGGRYEEAIAGLEAVFAEGPPITPTSLTLIDLMRTPARQAPSSLLGQLRFIRSAWGSWLGDALAGLLDRLDLAIGVLHEEELGLHRRFGGGPGPGDVKAHAPALRAGGEAPEAFSVDSAWMPQLVLIAKSTYVWLDQLSRRYGRHIRTLDAIPDEELDTLARRGVSGLWLIGLWQRSVASERIKRMRGNPDAVASAYSLDDYRIAEDLGGEAAIADLRERAWARGIRLASDMVPNHMGIDSRWVIEHPEWFLSVPQPPYPAYTYTGADLSPDERVGVVLEDHYWNDSDAAVTFKRFDRASGDERYVYHGNDGTSFPWNDTAQLDFLNPAVREQVIRTILDVARRFPVIRFDAAMVLARKHIQRLWWPLPGAGDGIPSRAAHALTQAEFDARMPNEFWREVVDRVAAEVPGTLLLAEAFWMLEGYFVRTLGMHRVYNSAFMHMLRDEDGEGYRRLIRETLEFDPEILKRYVNFMSNPDEATAVEQFGKGDKYFGVASVMATMPGLPMLGHGQVEGFGEKYGMEYRRATRSEQPDPWLVERHEREIFPLLHRRAWFAEANDFELYDVIRGDGSVDDDVLAYSNGSGSTRSLVVYHLRFSSTSGVIRSSAPVMRRGPRGGKRLVRRSIADALGIAADADAFVAYRDARTGLEYLRSGQDLHAHGWPVHLDAYQGHVFWEFRDLRDGASHQWRTLAGRLDGGGVPSLDAALEDLLLEPIHGPLRAFFGDGHATALLAGRATAVDLDALATRLTAAIEAVATATAVRAVEPSKLATEIVIEAKDACTDDESMTAPDRAALLGWMALSRLGQLAPGADVGATSAAWFDELRLASVLAAGLRSAGLDESAAWGATDRVRTLLRLPRAASARGRSAVARDRALLTAWLTDPTTRAALGVNTWQGVEWIDGDRLIDLARWAVRLDETDGHPADPKLPVRLAALAKAAGYRVDRLTNPPPASRKPRRRAK